jgi:DNA invertase Pin-like site-specific DNA recombinase
MTAIGYARVSTTDQDLTVQFEALKAAGCDVIRKEKASGTTTKGRTELATILDFIREGDTLVVTRIDRLARSIADLQDIVRTLRETNLRRERQLEGIAKAKAAGIYKGRKPTISSAEVRKPGNLRARTIDKAKAAFRAAWEAGG